MHEERGLGVGAVDFVNVIFQILLTGTLIVLFCIPLFLAFERPFMKKNWPSLFSSFFKRLKHTR